MNVRLSPATWLEVNGTRHGPGDVVDVDVMTGENMIRTGSAEPVIEEVKADGDLVKAGRRSGKN